MANYLMHRAYDPMVVGVYYNRDRLKTALDDLRFAGFSNDRIGVVARGDWAMPETKTINTPAVPNSAVTGAVIGGVWAMGVASGMVPALGPVVAGGILGSIRPSAEVGVSVGGVAGASIRLGPGEHEAHIYESEISAERVLLRLSLRGSRTKP